MCLGRQAESGAKGPLEKLARRRGEDRARGPAQKRPCRRIRLTRTEPDRDVDRDNVGVCKLDEVALHWSREVIGDEAAVVQDDRDPAALRPVDTRDPHARNVANILVSPPL